MTNEANFAIVGDGAYRVACPACARVSDVTRAEWCLCLGKDRTPACARCGACFCHLTLSQRQTFWNGAPGSLHARRRAEAKAGPPPACTQLAQAPLVMVVDDDEEIRAVGAHVITRLGFRCVTACGGAEALALFLIEEPAVVITDALMPKMDGRDLCRFIKRMSTAKVIIMTSLYTGLRYRNEAYTRYGADEYLAKPVDFGALQAMLRRLLPARELAA